MLIDYYKKNNTYSFVRVLIVILLISNLIFLYLVPNFHHHNHHSYHNHHTEHCCKIEIIDNFGVYINQNANNQGFSAEDCPIEKFIELFTSSSILNNNYLKIPACKIEQFLQHKVILISYLQIQSILQRAPPVNSL